MSEEDFIHDWRVSDQLSFSDHGTITFGIEFSSAARPSFRNPRRTNWVEYQNIVQSRLQCAENFDIKADLDRRVKEITDILYSSFLDTCPITYPGKKRQPVWWTCELGASRRNVRRLFNKTKRSRLDVDWCAYKSSFNDFKREIKAAKRASWINFCEAVQEVSDAARFRRLLSKNPRSIGFIQRPDGSWTNTGGVTLGILIDTHFPDCVSRYFRVEVAQSGWSGNGGSYG